MRKEPGRCTLPSRTVKIRPPKRPKITGSSTMMIGTAAMIMPQNMNSTMYRAMKTPIVT